MLLGPAQRLKAAFRLRLQLQLWGLRVERSPRLAVLAKSSLGPAQKRALLCYLPDPVLSHLAGNRFYNFSNAGLGIAWFKVLRRLGYAVDIISWDDTEWRPRHSYDLVVTHGGNNTELVLLLKAQGSKLIYFASGSYWKFHNRQADKRAQQFTQRHGQTLAPDRPIQASEERVLATADAIICLGTSTIKKTYRQFANVSSLEIGAYLDNHFEPATKDFAKARRNFLFFAGGGNLHKGLDLLLDAFEGLEEHLYIGTSLTKEFEALYSRQLYELPNVHYKGVVTLRSTEFYDLMTECAYAILPSCAEGSPGSVADCMQQGLIPVVTPEAGVATEDFGFIVTDIHPTALARQIKRLAQLEPSEIRQRSQATYQHSRDQQSPAAFEHHLQLLVANVS